MEPPQATDSVSQTRIKKRMDDVKQGDDSSAPGKINGTHSESDLV